MNDWERAQALRGELLESRRYLHEHAEVGLELPRTVAYISGKLKSHGLEPQPCGGGLTATVGQGERLLLLRADMDALPMAEESGLPFACPTGRQAHGCGHDLHAAMLLAAAKLLKEDEAALKGRVKLVFQPAEESFEGAKDMVAHGLLAEQPDAALAFHVSPGRLPVGTYLFNDTPDAAMMLSMDQFRITVRGRGTHGAYPHAGVDPINIGVHIYLALQELIARECDPLKPSVLTVGSFQAGEAPNIIPDTATLTGTIRTGDSAVRQLLTRRVSEVAQGVAATYGGSAEVRLAGVPPLICDAALVRELSGYIRELPIPGLTPHGGISSSASEDFAVIAAAVPSAYFYLSAGFEDERGDALAHNPGVQFNEDVLPIGAACMLHCARRWLASADAPPAAE